MSLRTAISVVAAVVAVIAVIAAAQVHAAEPATDPSSRELVDAAITDAGRSIPAQAQALARLAWPEIDGDPEVADLARLRLISYNENAISALRDAIRWVRPDQQEQVVRALVRAFLKIGYGLPPDFLPGLNDAAWYGSHDARVLAIAELGRFRYSSAVLTIIDAAYEDPSLAEVAIEALAAIGDQRARFFLEEMMLEGPQETRGLAASALARLGDLALLPLKLAVRSDDASTRALAVRALLPVATVDDLSTLHEYVYNHPDDDPATVESVRASAVALEELLARQISEDAASE